jgi:DNA-binding beta-propeller fold protein YncE
VGGETNGFTNTVTATITVVFGPRRVAVNQLTGQVYVANSGSNTMSVITPAR